MPSNLPGIFRFVLVQSRALEDGFLSAKPQRITVTSFEPDTSKVVTYCGVCGKSDHGSIWRCPRRFCVDCGTYDHWADDPTYKAFHLEKKKSEQILRDSLDKLLARSKLLDRSNHLLDREMKSEAIVRGMSTSDMASNRPLVREPRAFEISDLQATRPPTNPSGSTKMAVELKSRIQSGTLERSAQSLGGVDMEMCRITRGGSGVLETRIWTPFTANFVNDGRSIIEHLSERVRYEFFQRLRRELNRPVWPAPGSSASEHTDWKILKSHLYSCVLDAHCRQEIRKDPDWQAEFENYWRVDRPHVQFEARMIQCINEFESRTQSLESQIEAGAKYTQTDTNSQDRLQNSQDRLQNSQDRLQKDMARWLNCLGDRGGMGQHMGVADSDLWARYCRAAIRLSPLFGQDPFFGPIARMVDSHSSLSPLKPRELNLFWITYRQRDPFKLVRATREAIERSLRREPFWTNAVRSILSSLLLSSLVPPTIP
jgi:hypothetical protein